MKYKIILILVGISLVTSVIIGVSYAIWLLTETQTEDNVVEAGCFDISFTENTDAISLLNSYPVPDATGSQNTPFNFTVTNTCDLDAYYDINVEVLDTTTLDASLIKVKLDDDVPLLVTDGESKLATISGATSYKIGEGFLEAGISSTHDFRMWMDINATLDNSQNAVIYTKIVINASPIDTDIIDTTVCLEDYRNRNLEPTELSRFTYTETDTEVTITDFTDNLNGEIVRHVVIPCEINQKPVTVIGNGAFKDSEYLAFESVIIPNTVTRIEDDAFHGQYFTTLTIPEGVKFIGNNAFYPESNSKWVLGRMTELKLPNSLEHIGNSAFAANLINNVEIPNNVVTIGNSAFSGNEIVSLQLSNSLKTIGSSAFSGNLIESLNITNNVATIGNSAFSGNPISNLVLGSSVIDIGNGAFSGTAFTNIVIPKSVLRVGSGIFNGNTNLTEINIEGKSGIVDFAFYDNPWDTSLITVNYLG